MNNDLKQFRRARFVNIYIEFHGEQHYRPIDTFGGIDGLEMTQSRDRMKRRLVKKNGGRLIIISYKHFKKLSNGVYLSQRLKMLYKYWYFVDNELHVFDNMSDVKEKIKSLSKESFKELF